MVQITSSLAIDDSEIKEEFIRAAGPGGQNINKVSTAVQIRFDVWRSPSLPEDVRKRLLILARSRITDDGVLIITARQFRTQPQNRKAALDLLIALIRQATQIPKPHLKTRPTLASKRRRLEAKRRQGSIKRLRQTRPDHEE